MEIPPSLDELFVTLGDDDIALEGDRIRKGRRPMPTPRPDKPQKRFPPYTGLHHAQTDSYPACLHTSFERRSKLVRVSTGEWHSLPWGEGRLLSVGYGHPDESGIHPDCWGGGNSWAMAAMLQKRIEEFEPIARSRAGGITFSLVTSDSLHKVLSPAFLDRFSTSGLRKFDRIQVNADCQGLGERAMLLVEENLEGKVKVRKL